ncbi:hypothetical protein N9485_04660 [Luminiphilus sp.]|nr:hypothetical protein [Luminiphilus sp.]
MAMAACLALFWGAVDIVGVPPSRLVVQLFWVTLGVALMISFGALVGWCLNRLRRRP